MLTLKLVEHRNEHTGTITELIWPVKNVFAESDSSGHGGSWTVRATPVFPTDDGSVGICLSGPGTAYVMNEAGNTISRYWLGAESGAVGGPLPLEAVK